MNNFFKKFPKDKQEIIALAKEENLILLCPNCHSLKAGHSTSKGNGRRYYREKYHKEKRDSNP